MWGEPQEKVLKEFVDVAKEKFKLSNAGMDMASDEENKETKRYKREMKQKILAMVILKRADTSRYGSLQQRLKNEYLLGNNDYPETVPKVLELLNNYKVEYTVPTNTKQCRRERK